MAAANSHYYAHNAAIGGDFVTAPEISQMFGELIGVCLADLWERAERPRCHYVELGPGRGTLAVDARRAMAAAGLVPDVHFVETSARLRAEQAERLPGATWHDDVSTLPSDAPLLMVANEFFDALPIEQLIRGHGGWHQRLVGCQDTLFLPLIGKPVPDAIIPVPIRDAPVGSIVETSPATVGIIRHLSTRLAVQGGALVITDYGYDGPAIGETLQAVRAHQFVNPFDAPGAVDLSAHVDFATLAAAAQVSGAMVHGPVSQRDFLGQLGIAQRTAALAKTSPDRTDEFVDAHRRLTDPSAMGEMFRAMALTGGDWPTPAGFA